MAMKKSSTDESGLITDLQGNGDTGEWGYSKGKESAPRSAKINSFNSQIATHKLQHADYGSVIDDQSTPLD